MPESKTKKYLLSLIVIVAVAFVSGPLMKEKVIESARAGVTENVTGWLWGGSEDGNIGGSMGTIDGNDTNAYWTVMNNVDKDGNVKFPGSSSFGVNVPETDGVLSGYAWNGNLGWISFEQGDLSGCPGGHGDCNARRVGNNIQGWARILSIKTDFANGNSGGWKGWILLNSVVVDPATGKITGYGWNGENATDPPIAPNNVANGLGWINFDAEMGAVTTENTLQICYDSCANGFLVPDNDSMVLGDPPRNLKACYGHGENGEDPNCRNTSGVQDVTATADWSNSDNPNNSVTLSESGTDPKVMTAAAEGMESVSAKYSASLDSFTMTVNPTPTYPCWTCNTSSYDCEIGLYASMCNSGDGRYGDRDDCRDFCKKPNGDQWKEVAP